MNPVDADMTRLLQAYGVAGVLGAFARAIHNKVVWGDRTDAKRDSLFRRLNALYEWSEKR